MRRGLPLVVLALLAAPLASAATVDRVQVGVSGRNVTLGYSPSLFVDVTVLSDYMKVDFDGDDGSWRGPEYHATGKSDLGGSASVSWGVGFDDSAGSAAALAQQALVQKWPVAERPQVAVPHVIGGRRVGTIQAVALLTKSPGGDTAKFESALAFRLCGRVFAYAEFALLDPFEDDAAPYGQYVVSGVLATTWNHDHALNALAQVALDGYLPPGRLTAHVTGRRVSGIARDCAGHPLAGIRVQLVPAGGGGAAARAAASGAYGLRASHAGRYRVVVTVAGASRSVSVVVRQRANRTSTMGRVERVDVLVVGAGPAGSTAAHRLATAGARVLLVDKARFPRDKPCGGGITMRAVRELPVSVDSVVEHVVDRMAFRLHYGRSFERGGREPLILMTQRRRLDHFLAEQAAAAGAEFRDGVKVADLEAEHHGARAVVDGEPVEAEVLIGADGANGITARSLGLGEGPAYGVAFEGNVRHGAADPDRYRGLALIELGVIPGGYGWVFPKGDHVNVGVGGWEHVGPTLRARLGELCARHGIDPEAVESLRGHRLPLRRPGSSLARGRALLVGDAAGLVDPISGDGMYEGFLSSRLAAEAVLDVLARRQPGLEPYAHAISRRLGPMAAASWDAKIAFDRFPRLTFLLAGAPLVWGVVERILSGDLSHPGAARGLPRAPLRAIEALARAAGAPGSGYRLEARAA